MVLEIGQKLFLNQAAFTEQSMPSIAEAFASGFIISAIITLGILIGTLIAIGLYAYFSFCWFTIAKKQKHKHAWIAWIPFAQIALILQLGKIHWAWVFLILIPFFGWTALLVLFIIANWRVFEKSKYPGWFSLSIIIPKVGLVLYFVALGFLVWGKKKKRK